jgi:hypothetical protein
VTPLTRRDVVSTLGAVDDILVAKIIETGATAEELAEARAWLANDEALMNAGRPLATGRVARLVDILGAIKEEEEEDAAR